MVKTTIDPVKCKANYSRVCQLLVDEGGDALRAALHAVHPPSTLAAVLNANKSVLKKIRYSVINASQWELLFPASGTPDSRKFDVTLLTILLRNICGLPSPPTGWNFMPPASETSISANIARIKIFRNEVYGHTPSAQLDDTAFEILWQEISKPLVNLGIPQQDIAELKEAPLSSEEESYIKKLKEWKELEDDLLSKFNDLEKKLLKLQTTMENVNLSQVNKLSKCDFSGKIDGLCKKFQDGTRQWFFEKLSSWLSNKESRVMILTAGPGVGKSVLSAKVCDTYKKNRRLAAYHFCDCRNSDSRNPNTILQSLASQMCDNVEGFSDKLTEALCHNHSLDSLPGAFHVLLNNPLHALHSREPMLIVIDALDESKTDVKSELLEMISHEFRELPEWIKILISSRPELQVRKKLQHLNPLEILPDDYHHNLDLKLFIVYFLPGLNNVSSLISKCEGSFLYAYYLVNELKEMDLGIEPNLSDYVPKGISGFYEKQFKRLKIGLQRFHPHTWSFILKCFLNVVATSIEPLPIKILFTCMGLFREEYEKRETIIGMMSEILPLYEDCLTVYHKSLWDWLTLNGFDEHAFVGDVVDGTKRLWQACKNIYGDIASLRSVSDFQISSEIRYALRNGGKYLLDVGTAEDFHWLVNVRLNFFKLKFYNSLNVEISRILQLYKPKRSDYHYWSNIHLRRFSNIMKQLTKNKTLLFYVNKREMYYIYLQTLANGFFHPVQEIIDCKNEAIEILDATNELWLEEMGSEFNSNFKVISHTIVRTDESSVLEFETPTNNSVASFASRSHNKCYAGSADNLYLACCDENGNLTIRDVDSGETTQTVELKQSPVSSWWSELYLWVVCNGVVVKYPYDSTRTKVLGNYLEECAINLESVLKFAEGVLVTRISNKGKISILKIRNEKIYPQQIPDPGFTATSAAISSDGCAVLLYRKYSSDYQLWEVACEDTWELRSTGKLPSPEKVSWFCLTGTENSRSSVWVTHMFTSSDVDWSEPLRVSSIDFPSDKRGFSHQLPLQHFVTGVIYVDSNILIIHKNEWIYLVNVPVGKIITSLYVGLFPGFQNLSSFYIPSRGILVFAGTTHTKFFKIHNIESNLPS